MDSEMRRTAGHGRLKNQKKMKTAWHRKWEKMKKMTSASDSSRNVTAARKRSAAGGEVWQGNEKGRSCAWVTSTYARGN